MTPESIFLTTMEILTFIAILAVSQFYSVDYDLEKPYNVYGGMQDNGVWFGPSNNKFDYKKGKFDNGDNFKFLLGGDGIQKFV